MPAAAVATAAVAAVVAVAVVEAEAVAVAEAVEDAPGARPRAWRHGRRRGRLTPRHAHPPAACPGVLSMGRYDDPNSGGSSFSMLLGTAAHLDMQYTIFA